jgi:hypothetical protein
MRSSTRTRAGRGAAALVALAIHALGGTAAAAPDASPPVASTADRAPGEAAATVAPPPPAAEGSLVAIHTGSARSAARRGDCRTARMLGEKVRQLDADYYRSVFAVDAEINGCVAGRSTITAAGAPADGAGPARPAPPHPRATSSPGRACGASPARR